MRKNLVFLDFEWVFGKNPSIVDVQRLNFILFEGDASLILHAHCDIDALHHFGLFTKRIIGYGGPELYPNLHNFAILGDYEKFSDPYHTIHLRKGGGISKREAEMAVKILKFHDEVI